MDIERINSLIALMVEHDLTEIEIEEGETHILLKRGPGAAASGAPTAVAAPSSAAAPAPPAETAPAAPAEAHIRSPMVGTFYAAPDPESPPFVSVGDLVEPDTVVCLVEAMKVFNEIKAEVSGRLTKLLVNNAEAVEYDQPLFAVAPA
ncbi:MAG: acetyl-CoA carboxylase biotin carboxyl carrier protein [Phycisphaerae bacterium]